MTELQKLYVAARMGRKHHAALREIARKTGLDPATIQRSLKRADRDYPLQGVR